MLYFCDVSGIRKPSVVTGEVLWLQ